MRTDPDGDGVGALDRLTDELPSGPLRRSGRPDEAQDEERERSLKDEDDFQR
ncbi:MAG: hypothetical protein AAFV53_22435 [Myxococcota bacterium]